MKNITKHCTPDELSPGARYLVAEHRKCIGELKRLKLMIADLANFISTLHEKGRGIMNAYISLKTHLDELSNQIDQLSRENEHHKSTLSAIRSQLEEWKSKARDLQTELDEMRTKFHDLEVEHKEMGVRLKECVAAGARCSSENERMKRRLQEQAAGNSELKRRLTDAKLYREQLAATKTTIGKLEYKVEKLLDKAERVKDDAAECKLDLISAKSMSEEEAKDYKDTRVDLNMEMWILHNKTTVAPTYPTTQYEYTTTTYSPPTYKGTCLLTYYGYTNETCWYETKENRVDYGKVNRQLGNDHDQENKLPKFLCHHLCHHSQHLVEAHWKYFTIEVPNANECDRATQLHYEYLLNRCQPKHYLPVISIFRPSNADKVKELTSHIYPKPNIPQPGSHNRCWITFLGPHGHCEAGMNEYPLYNSDDTPNEGYGKTGSGTSKSRCLARKASWESFCKTPVVVTYLPESVSTNWEEKDIVHDSHGSQMFEDPRKLTHKINPESLDPNHVSRPSPQEEGENGHEDYEDTPEFRKSLNMEGTERQRILSSLRLRLGLPADANSNKPFPGSNQNVRWHRPATEVVKGSGIAAAGQQSSSSSSLLPPVHGAAPPPQIGQFAANMPSGFHDNTKASHAGSLGYGANANFHPSSST